MQDTNENYDNSKDIVRAKLLGSLLLFTRTFFKIRTGREFNISYPSGRESHFITICKVLTDVFRGNKKRVIIQIPPRYGKTELVIHFIAWAMARYPESNFLYVSYAKTLAKRSTQIVRDIINLPEYRDLFAVSINQDTSAKDDFLTNNGGSVYAAGAEGSITGRGAGVRGCSGRFSGCAIIDDIHKPDEATSDTIRNGTIEWYHNTMSSRLNNGEDTPIIFIGQHVHEYDLQSYLLKLGGWEAITIPALDPNNNALYPELHDKDALLKMKEENPYIFALQFQQEDVPAGAQLINPGWFVLLEEEPEVIFSFVTVDSAETNKEYNDATVFSHFGVYKIKQNNIETDILALHWINCEELRVEPRDLESEFLRFMSGAMRYKCPAYNAAIEKKSTGTYLISLLENFRGLNIIPLERNSYGSYGLNSKSNRFIAMQPYLARKLVSLPRYGKHTHLCLEHMKKITPNNTHAHDDIADTLSDAIQITFMDKTIQSKINIKTEHASTLVKSIAGDALRLASLRRAK